MCACATRSFGLKMFAYADAHSTTFERGVFLYFYSIWIFYMCYTKITALKNKYDTTSEEIFFNRFLLLERTCISRKYALCLPCWFTPRERDRIDHKQLLCAIIYLFTIARIVHTHTNTNRRKVSNLILAYLSKKIHNIKVIFLVANLYNNIYIVTISKK